MEQKTEASQAVDEPVLPHLPRAVGYRHTMDNTEGLKGNKPVAVFCVTKPNPFGIPGLDYSASFPVTTETLFTADQMKAYARAALKAQPAPTEALTEPKDHNVRQLVNDLRDIAKTFHATQQLRDRISGAVQQFLAPIYAKPAPTEAAQGESPFKFRPWSKEADMVEGWTAAEKAREAAQGAQLSGISGELAQGEDSARLDAERYRPIGMIVGNDKVHGWHLALDPGESWNGIGHHKRVYVRIDAARASAETGGVKP